MNLRAAAERVERLGIEECSDEEIWAAMKYAWTTPRTNGFPLYVGLTVLAAGTTLLALWVTGVV